MKHPYRITKEYTFAASHRLPPEVVGIDHKCHRLHGHNYVVIFGLEGQLSNGWIIDYGELDTAVARTIELLDHSHLNHDHGMWNPTSENLARFIYDKVKPAIPQLADVTVCESPRTSARYRPC